MARVELEGDFSKCRQGQCGSEPVGTEDVIQCMTGQKLAGKIACVSSSGTVLVCLQFVCKRVIWCLQVMLRAGYKMFLFFLVVSLKTHSGVSLPVTWFVSRICSDSSRI